MFIKKGFLFVGLLLSTAFFSQRTRRFAKKECGTQKQIALINKELAKTKDEAKLSLSYLNNNEIKKISLRKSLPKYSKRKSDL